MLTLDVFEELPMVLEKGQWCVECNPSRDELPKTLPILELGFGGERLLLRLQVYERVQLSLRARVTEVQSFPGRCVFVCTGFSGTAYTYARSAPPDFHWRPIGVTGVGLVFVRI